MPSVLYEELGPWYRLLDPPEDHEEEAGCYLEALDGQVARGPATLLELGAGAGHNALFLKRRFECTLTDLSPVMHGLSRELNPECQHLVGDMRTLRLEQTFDAVFIHDAVGYMKTRQELLEALTTAFVHTKPGGALLVTPDHVADTFMEQTSILEHDAGERSLRGLEWTWDPKPDDEQYAAAYSLFLREGAHMRHVHEQHVEGLFSSETWLELLGKAGFRPSVLGRQLGDGGLDQMFLGVRPT